MAQIIPVGVAAGYTFVADVNEKILVTRERLNQLGRPTASVELPEHVGLEAIATVGTESSNVVTVAVQVRNASQGNPDARVGLWCWLSDAEGGGVYTLPSGGAPTVVDGAALQVMTDSAAGLYLCDADGLLTLTFTNVGALTRHFVALLQNARVLGSQSMVWT